MPVQWRLNPNPCPKVEAIENTLLFLVTSLIWGSTWLAITYQLGPVAPEISIVYRFALAAAVLLAYSALRRLPLRYGWREHLYIALQGMTLFSINYIFVYLAELHVTSGMVAMVFSLIIVLNVLFAALFLRDPIRPRVVRGAVFGIAGLGLVFWPELSNLEFTPDRALGLTFAFAATISASIGNILAARNQRRGLPIVQTNALGMAYGTLFTLAIALLRGAEPDFEFSLGYVTSLAYLAVFGSVVAFGSYLTLVARIGPDRAAYISVVFPIVALALSTLFEGLSWTFLTLLGVLLVIVGNALALAKTRRVPRERPLGRIQL